MPELITQYVKELKSELSSQMNPYEAQLISEEVHSHLLDRFEAYQSLGSDPHTAELEAIRSFGPCNAICDGFKKPKIRQLPALGPFPSNLVYLVSFLTAPLFERTIPAPGYWLLLGVWILLPTISRRPPWIGMLIGMPILETYWVVSRNGNLLRDIPLMLQFAAMSLASWTIGWLIRYGIGFLLTRFGIGKGGGKCQS